MSGLPDNAVAFIDDRLGAAKAIKKALRYVFPDHWSFMLGEIALYSFVVLVGTGIFLTIFFVPSHATTVYTGGYAPLQGMEMSEAYRSVVHISLTVPTGLIMRQTHHWAANVFIAAIVLHLLRVVFTGAFRRPRDINYFVGVTMLVLGMIEGFFGYSLIDDLVSGMGLIIAYAVLMSVPVIGGHAAMLAFGGEWPGSEAFWPRMFIVHVLIIPVVLAGLIALHLAMIARPHHTQFRGPRRTEDNVVGTPTWPGYALRSLGLFALTAGVLFALGGLVQINPIWEWGPYHTWLGSNGAQPDWYLGWLIGGLRLMFPFEPHILGYTLFPSPFWGGVLFPTAVFVLLYAIPAIDRRINGDHAHHHLLDLPVDNPRRTAIGVAFFAWVATVFAIGSIDRVYFTFDIPYEGQIWFWRFAIIAVPVVAYLVAYRVARDLRDRRALLLRGRHGEVVRRRPDGAFEPVPPEERAPSQVDGT